MIIFELRQKGRELLRPLLSVQSPINVSNPVSSIPQASETALCEEILWLEVDILLAHVLSCERNDLLLFPTRPAKEEDVERFFKYVNRRRNWEPIAYIIGTKEFYSLSFLVTPSVLIPRPETELLVDRALCHFSSVLKNFLLIDIGTGSGSVILAVLHELRCKYGNDFLGRGLCIATDISREALRVAQANARRFQLEPELKLLQADLLEGVDFEGSFERRIITANLPYIADDDCLPEEIEHYEPRLALRGGDDGLWLVRRFVEQVKSSLRGDTVVLLEIGAGQKEQLQSFLKEQGITDMSFYCDLAGRERVVEIRGGA